MARIVTLGAARQELYLIDHDDFVTDSMAGHSRFSQLMAGRTAQIDKIAFDVGGSGVNAAVACARYGHESVYLGTLAHDPAGEAVLERLDREGVDSSYLSFVSEGTTGCAVILLDTKSRQSTELAHAGVSSGGKQLKPSDLKLIQPDWLYAGSLDGDMETLLAFFEQAHALGTKILFNPGTAELKWAAKLAGLLELTDVLIVNKHEAAQIVPGVLLTELLARLANYCPTVIITDGEMGAIATNGVDSYRLGVYEQVKVKDLCGVGDAFAAGFLAALAETADFEQALKFAAANAAAVAQGYGPQAGLLNNQADLHPMPIQVIDELSEKPKE